MIHIQIRHARSLQPVGNEVTYRATDIQWSTDKHGYGYARFFLPCAQNEQLFWYTYQDTLEVVISKQTQSYFEGIIWDIEIVASGIQFTAYGWFKLFETMICTDMWSKSAWDTKDWYVTDQRVSSFRNPKLYDIDVTTNGVRYNLLKNTLYTTQSGSAALNYVLPDKYTRPIRAVTFYLTTSGTPSTIVNSNVRVLQYTPESLLELDLSAKLTNVSNVNNRLYTVFDTGSRNAVQVMNNIVASNFFAGENGTWFTAYSGIRIGTTTSISGNRLYADEIVQYVLSGINTLQTNLLSASTAFIQSPGIDIQDYGYEDTSAAVVLDTLTNAPYCSGVWNVQIWNDRILQYQPAQGNGATWYVDVALEDLQLARTYSNRANRTRIVYTSELTGRTLRTDYAQDSLDQARYGLILEAVEDGKTNNATTASGINRAFLQQRIATTVQAQLPDFAYVYDVNGAKYSAMDVRQGDTIIIRNLPIELAETLSFTVASTQVKLERYDAQPRVTIEPNNRIATLENVLVGKL